MKKLLKNEECWEKVEKFVLLMEENQQIIEQLPQIKTVTEDVKNAITNVEKKIIKIESQSRIDAKFEEKAVSRISTLKSCWARKRLILSGT